MLTEKVTTTTWWNLGYIGNLSVLYAEVQSTQGTDGDGATHWVRFRLFNTFGVEPAQFLMADVELSEGRPRGLFNILDDEGNAHRDLRAGIYACARRFLKFTPIASPPSDHAPTAQELKG